MSTNLPEVVDAPRMVSSRRCFEGQVALARMPRLAPLLAAPGGSCSFRIEFGRDSLGVDYVELSGEAGLPLLCQRSLEVFELPVRIEQRLGLIVRESQEAALPPDYEPLLLPEDRQLRLLELIEDELILAVPAVPVDPQSEPVEFELLADDAEDVEPEETLNPFAALAALKPKPKPE